MNIANVRKLPGGGDVHRSYTPNDVFPSEKALFPFPKHLVPDDEDHHTVLGASVDEDPDLGEILLACLHGVISQMLGGKRSERHNTTTHISHQLLRKEKRQKIDISGKFSYFRRVLIPYVSTLE